MTVFIGLLLGISVVIDPHTGSILFSAIALFVGLYAQTQINQAQLGTLCVKDLSVDLSPCMKLGLSRIIGHFRSYLSIL